VCCRTKVAAKVARLYDGRKGVKIQIGIVLYKTLVRPHLEYAVPVWGAVKDKEIEKLQQIQIQCLKQTVGAKCHSSSAAVEVIAGVIASQTSNSRVVLSRVSSFHAT